MMRGRLTVTSPADPTTWMVGTIALAGVVMSAWAAPDMRGVIGAMLAIAMLAIAVCDARHGIIPNELNAIGLALAVAHAAVWSPDFITQAIMSAILRGCVLGLLFLA